MAVIRDEKNLGTGLGIKLKKYIKIKAIVSIFQIRITCIMLILEIIKSLGILVECSL